MCDCIIIELTALLESISIYASVLLKSISIISYMACPLCPPLDPPRFSQNNFNLEYCSLIFTMLMGVTVMHGVTVNYLIYKKVVDYIASQLTA